MLFRSWFENGVLFGSTDADWHVEFSIILSGVTSLSELDLIL